MSMFRVEVVRVEVEPHPQADRLDLVKVKGWQCVTRKGEFKTGDLAIYMPVDSVLPPALVAKLGIEKFYSRRLKTIKLRGYVSQGMVAPVGLLSDCSVAGLSVLMPSDILEGLDVTMELGITKYDPPIPVSMSGIQLPDHESFFKYTDIENVKNYPSGVFEPGELVVVTEKIHGTNFRAAKIDGVLYVGSHRMNLKDSPENLYWRAARLLKLDEQLKDGEQVFGEVYGHNVQDLTYGKKEGEIAVGVFDVMKDTRYLNYADYNLFCRVRGWGEMMVPVLACATWAPDLAALATGQSIIAPRQMREGVVIKPVTERFSERLQGRCILKSINDEYLLREAGTENH